MAISGTNSTTLDDLFVNIVAQARFEAEQASLMMGLVSNYNIAGQAGKTVQVPRYPKITAAALDEGTAPTDTDVSTTMADITVSEVGNTVLLTDLAAMGAGNPAQEIGTSLGRAIATKIDVDLIGKFTTFTTDVGATGASFTAAHLFKAAATIRANGVSGALAAVVHPFMAYDLKSSLTTAFANPQNSDIVNEAMRTGYVGTIAGIDIYESNNISIDTAGQNPTNDGVAAVFSPEALAIALKSEFNLETQRNATRRGTELVATAIYGVDVLDDDHAVKMTLNGTL